MEEKKENAVRGYSYEPDEKNPVSRVEDAKNTDIEHEEYVVIDHNTRPPEEVSFTNNEQSIPEKVVEREKDDRDER